MKTDRRRIRYVTLSWTDPSRDPDRRYTEANFPEDTVVQILDGLRERKISPVYVEGKEFPLSSVDDVFAAEAHMKACLEARKRRR